MSKLNKYVLLRKAPLSQRIKLRLHGWMLERDYERDLHKFRKAGVPISEWDAGNYGFEFEELDEEEARFHCKRLLNRARTLRLPIPKVYTAEGKLSEDWERSRADGRYRLSIHGESRLRQSIREEEKFRAEAWGRRIPFISALSGLIGTITGSVALLMKGP